MVRWKVGLAVVGVVDLLLAFVFASGVTVHHHDANDNIHSSLVIGSNPQVAGASQDLRHEGLVIG